MKKPSNLTWIKRLPSGTSKRSEDGPWSENIHDLKGCLLRCGDHAFEFKMFGDYVLRERKVMNSQGPDAIIGWSLTYNIPTERNFTQIGIYKNSSGAIIFPIEKNGFLSRVVQHTYNVEGYNTVTCDLNRKGQIQLSFS